MATLRRRISFLKTRRGVFPLLLIAVFLMASLPNKTYSDEGTLLPVVKEREPNNTIGQAQRLNIRSVVSGKLEATDPNFQFVFLDVAGLVDNYRVQTTSPGLLVGDLSFGRGLVVCELAPDVINGNGPVLDSFLQIIPGLPGLFGGAGDPNLCVLALNPTRVIDRSINGFDALPEFGLGGSDLPGPPDFSFFPFNLLIANDQANRAESVPKIPRRAIAGPASQVVSFPAGNYIYSIWDGSVDILDILLTSALVTFTDIEGVSEFDNINSVVFTSDTPSPYQLKVGFQPSHGNQPVQTAPPVEPIDYVKTKLAMNFRHLNQMAAGGIGRKLGQQVSDAYKITIKQGQPLQFDLVLDQGNAQAFSVYQKTGSDSYKFIATANWVSGPEDVGLYMSTGKLNLESGDYYITIPGSRETLYTLSATDGVSADPLAYTFKLTPTKPLFSKEQLTQIITEAVKLKKQGKMPTLEEVMKSIANNKPPTTK